MVESNNPEPKNSLGPVSEDQAMQQTFYEILRESGYSLD